VLPWRWTLDGLLERANVAGENHTARDVRKRGRSLLDLLGRAGLVKYELVGEGVQYDVPPALRTLLASVPPRRSLPKKKP
jgi:hypothetical protein